MKTAIVGAGPTGLFLGMTLARRGHDVTVVDRDRGPDADGAWARKGVMQFELPHFFRPQVRATLLELLPDVELRVVDAGAEPTVVNPMDPGSLAYRCRRSVFEQAMRAAAVEEPGLTIVGGHADSVAQEAGRATGVVVDGTTMDADLVIDASGRSGRFTDDLRAPAEASDSGQSYGCRQYRLLPGAEPGPITAPPGWAGMQDGYLVIVFLQDAGTFQFLFVRPTEVREFGALRDGAVFDAAAASIPGAATWVEPDRAVPVGPPMVGAGLWNSYRGQLTEDGTVGLPGVVFVGDAVLTTNPSAGRGVTTSLLQARRLLDLLDEHSGDFAAVSLALDAWTAAEMRPWFEDHVAWDAGLLQRWRGEPLDLDGPLNSELICALADVDPSVMSIVGPYWSMQAGPASLQPLEEQARALHKSGHQMPTGNGPTRDGLIEVMAGAGGR